MILNVVWSFLQNCFNEYFELTGSVIDDMPKVTVEIATDRSFYTYGLNADIAHSVGTERGYTSKITNDDMYFKWKGIVMANSYSVNKNIKNLNM